MKGDPSWDFRVKLDIVPTIVGNDPERPAVAVISEFTTNLFLHDVIPCVHPDTPEICQLGMNSILITFTFAQFTTQ